MSFLNPLVLYALAAAAIPLLIHLLNRRKIKRIPFSTVQFLKQLEKKQMRNLKIRQWLLLLLRTLIIASLVLAFSRPTIRSGSGGFAERSPIEAIVVIDNSMSINEARLTGTLLGSLRSAFAELEGVFQSGDRLTIIQATQPLTYLARQEAFDATLWERVQVRLQSNSLKSNLGSALRQAGELAAQSVYAAREIYVISDFQESAAALAADAQTPAFTRWYAVPISHENRENLSVDSVWVENKLLEVNQPITVMARLQNHHPAKNMTTLVSLVINGQRVAQKNISVDPGRVEEVNFSLTLTQKGFIEAFLEVEGDALLEDNRRYFNVFVPEKLSLLHITPALQTPTFLPLILQPALEQGIFDYQREAAGNWSARNFSEADLIVLENLEQVPPALAARLESFTRAGGGTFIIPAPKVALSQYRDLLQKLGLGEITPASGNPEDRNSFLTLSEIDRRHPIFEGLFEERQTSVNPLEIYARYPLKMAAGAAAPVRLSDGSPLLVQAQSGQGAAFVLGVPLDNAWSELPGRGFVVPLIYRILYYGGTRKIQDRHEVLTGKTYQIRLENLEAPFDFSLKGPNNVDVKLTPAFQGANALFDIRDTGIPGNYRLIQNERTLAMLSVNAWKEESLQDFMDEGEIAGLLPDGLVVDNVANIAEVVRQSRFGRELWRLFLALALGLLLVEMLVA
ncbi:MAG TPA: BatA domain-containing protein, partial [Calditrichia bacterium]|nr:BatA domain-containing protein [Calditrichia bacterium]